jgi:hypothetical protein
MLPITAGNGLTGDVSPKASTPTLAVGAGTGILSNANDVAVDQSTNFAWTGIHSYTNTLTATSSQTDFNLTLGNDGDADTVSAINIDVTSAATADADLVYGINIADLTTASAVVTETALRIGANWENALDLNGTLLTSAELAVLDGGIDVSTEVSGILPVLNGGTGANTLNNLITLGTHTTGNYVATIADSGAGTITVTGSGSETAGVTLGITNDSIGDTQLAFNTGQNLTTSSSVIFADLTLNNSGLHILDTNASHDLIFAVGSDLTADRTLTITTGDSDRTLTLTGNATISGTNTGDQNLFASIPVSGQTTVTANSTTTALTFVAGTNVTITTDNTAKSITFNAASGSGDITDVGDCSTGACFTGASGTTLTFDDADGDKTFKYDTTNNRFEVNAPLAIGATGVTLTDDGDGAITLKSISAGNQEDLTINLDDTANTIVLSSSTGVTGIDFGSFNLTTTGALAGATLNTGHGANELYAMDQDVLTSSSPTFADITCSSTTCITLGTETGGNYVATITAGNGLTGDVSSEGSTPTLAVGAGTGILSNANDVAVDQSTNFAWTGIHSYTNTLTATSSQTDFNLTLGNDGDADTSLP